MGTRRLLSIVFVLALVGGSSAAAPGKRSPTLEGMVVGAVDGSTLLVRLSADKVETVSLRGVRAPSAGSCYARQSKDETHSLAVGRRASLTGLRRDRKGRLSAHVTLRGRVDLGRRLLAAGYAQLDLWGARSSRFLGYLTVQQQAEANGRGMWADCGGDVAVSLAVSPRRVGPGGRLTYTATITDVEPLTPRKIRLDLRPPASVRVLTASSANGVCTVADWIARCMFEEIPEPNAIATFVVQTTAVGTVSTRAQVSFAGCVRQHCGSSPLREAKPDDNSTAVIATVSSTPPATGDETERQCDAHYPDVCIPPPPPFLHCADIPHRNFSVPRQAQNSDPHGLDGDLDGVGCQKDDY